VQRILAVDAGGTATRAAVLNASGRCLGYGVAGGGNPVSAGLDAALEALSSATEQAIGAAGPPAETASALIAAAGISDRTPLDLIRGRLAALGVQGAIEMEADLLAMFCSGTLEPNGYVLVAGTGSVAARVEDRRLAAVADGTGWLLGDDGSGYWIGHRVVRAVTAALDGRAPATELTDLVLSALQLQRHSDQVRGRPQALMDLMGAVYAKPPIELSRLAPLAFQAANDPVACSIVAAAASGLGNSLRTVWSIGVAGPVVVGGSVATRLIADPTGAAEALRAVVGDAPLTSVRDGLVGAAVLGLERAGARVDADIFALIERSLAALRTGWTPSNPMTSGQPSTAGRL
jgi:N-acetylglucosamine kinase-like BadF-type ATPase